MAKMISYCPVCSNKLNISTLTCKGCGMELKNDFELSAFDSLNPEQYTFLITFLKHRGNLNAVQKELNVSYPTAKKQLDNLLVSLNLLDDTADSAESQEVIDMSTWTIPEDSNKASDIIKLKLMENGGKATVYTTRGIPCDIRAASDGISFISSKLPINPPWQYKVFDIIVDLLVSQGGTAEKGNGRNYKLGEGKCTEKTVVGAIGYHYLGKSFGDSVYDPIFVLAAVLEWAGIAHNGRGELTLTDSYRRKINL